MTDYRQALMMKDEAFIGTFHPHESRNYKREFHLISTGQIDPNIWFNKLRRVHDDQTVFDDLTKRYFEPIDVGISGNKLVNEGLELIAESIITGQGKNFDNYAVGRGTTSVNIRDTQLADEIIRLDIKDNGGFALNRGTTLFYSLFFPESVISATVTETAINDRLDKTIDNMLLRTLFPSNEYQIHVKGLDSIYAGHIIYLGTV